MRAQSSIIGLPVAAGARRDFAAHVEGLRATGPDGLQVDARKTSKNRWLVNGVSHRAWDPVSGQADYKKLAARIERI